MPQEEINAIRPARWTGERRLVRLWLAARGLALLRQRWHADAEGGSASGLRAGNRELTPCLVAPAPDLSDIAADRREFVDDD